MNSPDSLSREDVSKVARLSRLWLDEQSLERSRVELGAVLGYVRLLRELDAELAGVEPLSHPGDASNRWDEDEPRAPMANQVAMGLAPEASPPFFKVPKVIGDAS